MKREYQVKDTDGNIWGPFESKRLAVLRAKCIDDRFRFVRLGWYCRATGLTVERTKQLNGETQ